MPSDVLITPASSKIDFTDGNNSTKRLNISGTAFNFNSNLNVLSSTSLSSAFKAEGVNGTLFEVIDDLSNSLMSVNTIGGLPVFEVFANNSIIGGQYGANDFVISGNKIGLGLSNPVNKLSVSGAVSIGASYNVAAPANGLIVQGNVGIGTVSPTNGTLQVYNASGNTLSLQKSGGFAALAMGSETTVYALIESINTGGIRFYTGNGTQAERWKITSAGVLESTGAQTIRTSIDSLTLATNAGNGHILLSPHGNGNVGIGVASPRVLLDLAKANNVGQVLLLGETGANIRVGFGLAPSNAGMRIFSLNHITDGLIEFGGISSTDGSTWTRNHRLGLAGANSFFNEQGGNVGIGTITPAYKLDVNGATRFGGIVYNESVQTDDFNYFNLQPYIESETLSTILNFGGTAPSFITLTNTTAPFSKVMSVSAYGEALMSDYIPVQAGETIYGEIWTYRATGAAGTAGVIYCGVQRYDKDKKMIDGNGGLNTPPSGYFIASNQTIPSNSTWTKYSGTLVLPTSHTPYNTSDGGPVRYIRPYIIYNYTAGTILTYIGGWKIRKVELTRDAGPVAVNGSVAIGSNSVNYGRLQISAATTTPNLSTTNPTDVSLIISNSDVAYGTMFATYGDGKGALQQRRTNAATYYDFSLQPHGGNVGIGTISPLSLLEIYKVPATSTTLQTMLTINTDFASASGTGFGGSIVFRGRTAGNLLRDNAQITAYNEDIGDNGYALGFFTRPSDGGGLQQRLTILRGGNVGIGTISPASKLSIAGSSATNFKSLILRNGDGTVGSTVSIDLETSAGTIGNEASMAARISGIRLGSGTTGGLIFSTTNSGTLGERVRIINNGNVGIGTTSPVQKLELHSTVGDPYTSGVNQDGIMRFSNTTDNAVFDIGMRGGGAGAWLQSTDKTNLGVNYPLLLNPNGGNVSIGALTASNKLHVNGSVSIGSNYNTAATTNGLIVEGNVGIGITGPTAKLDVEGTNVNGYSLLLRSGDNYNGTDSVQIAFGFANQTNYRHSIRTRHNPLAPIGGVVGNNIDFYVWKRGTDAAADLGSQFVMTMQGDGNVGIGTISPTQILDVRGNIKLGGDNSGNYIYYVTDVERTIVRTTRSDVTQEGLLRSDGWGNFTFNKSIAVGYSLGSGPLTGNIYASGSIGIGTTIPTAKLDVLGVRLGRDFSIANRATVRLDANGAGFPSDILFGHTAAANQDSWNGVYWSLSSRATANSNRFYFYRGTGNPAPNNSEAVIMSFDPNLNVGVGFEAPTNRLSIAGSVSIGSGYNTAAPTNGLIVEGSVAIGATTASDKLTVANGNISLTDSYKLYNGSAADSAGLFFSSNQVNISGFSGIIFRSSTTNIPGQTERMRITNNGNIGIGITVPSAALHVNSTTSGATLLRADGTNGTLFSVVDDLSDSLMSVNNSAGLPVLEVFADDRVVAGQYGANDFVLVNNKIGIGNANPLFKLDVTGSFGLNAGANDGNWPFLVVDTSSSGGTNRYALNKIGAMGFNNADNYAQLQLVGSSGAYIDFANAAVDDFDARIIYYSNSRFDIQYGTVMTINSTGVGIGTTSPGYLFAVNNGSDVWHAQFGQVGGNQFRIGGNTTNGAVIGAYANNSNNNPRQLLLNRDGGNVGIGVSNALNKLHVYSSVAGSGSERTTPVDVLTLESENTTAQEFTGFGQVIIFRGSTYNNNTQRTLGKIIHQINDDSVSTTRGTSLDFQLLTDATGSTLASRMYIKYDGNVGIGNTNPTSKLQVTGGIQFGYGSDSVFYTGTEFDSSKYLILQNNTDSYGRIGLAINAKTFNGANTPSTNDGWAMDPRSGIRFRGWLTGDSGYDTKFVIQHLLANATNAVGDFGIFAKGFSTTIPAFVLTGGGRIGISTTTPAALLQIGTGTPTSVTDGIQFGGDVSARLYRTAPGVITCSGTIAATFSGSLTGNVTGNVSGSSGSCTGNAATATKLFAGVNINGTSFDGSAAITTTNWGATRSITIGATPKNVNGGADVSWTVAEVVGYTPAYGTAVYQTKSLDAVSTPGLYQYDGGFGGTKPPDNKPNYRTIEIGNGGRWSQIALPWDNDGFFFRRQEGATYTNWRTVIHDGNYTSYPDATKLPLAGGTLTGTLTATVIKGDAGANYPHSFTNTDAGNTHWVNRSDRLLTSNGTGWQTDGRDPIMALVTSGNSNSLNIANSIGLALHNESQTNNTFSPAITFSNRSNSGSYNTTYAAIIGRKTGQGPDSNWSAGELHFYTMPVGAYVNNIPSLIINSAGNVGVGIIAPAAKLNVLSSTSLSSVFKAEGINGTLFEVTDDLSNSLMSVNTIGGLPVFEVFANNSIIAGQYGRNDFVISGNKIGIGTASPVYKLDVYESSSADVARFYNNSSSCNFYIGSTNNTTATALVLYTSNGNGQIFKNRSSTAWGGADSFNIYSSNGAIAFHPAGTTNAVYFATNGNVGINNINPGYKLDVNGTSVFRDTVNIGPSIGTITWGSMGGGTGFGVRAESGRALSFGAGGNFDHLVINTNGNVGIGTTAPATVLQINTGTPTAATGGIQFGNDTGTRLYRSGPATITCSGTIAGTFSGTATNATQLGGVAASSYVRNDVDGTDSTALFRLKTITKSLTVTTSWIDTGIVGADLPDSGAYILTLNVDNYAVNGGHYNETYAGIMYWYSGGTNDLGVDEIPLHKSGHAPNGKYINLRTVRQLSGGTNLKLQIISNVATNGASNYIFKFRRMI